MVTLPKKSLITCLLGIGALAMTFLTGVAVYKLTDTRSAMFQDHDNSPLGYKAPYTHVRRQFYCSLEQKPWAQVVKSYLAEQQKNEQTLLEEFFALVGIDQQKFNECKKEYYHFYLESEERQRCDVSKRAHKIMCKKNEAAIVDFLTESGLVFDDLNIISTEEMGIAAATQSNLYIDDASIVDDCKELTCIAKADLLHEMQHILHDDSFNMYVLTNLADEWAQNCPKKTTMYTELLQRFSRFRENRADILAGLVDPMYARVSADFYKDVMQQYGDSKLDDHPTNSQRCAYLDRLHKEMIEVQNV